VERVITFIHTLSLLIGMFDVMCKAIIPSSQPKHILDEPLLERIRQRGRLTGKDVDRVKSHIELAEAIGAKAALVSCSTISPCVDEIRAMAAIPVIKIDEAMIKTAVAEGTTIGVVATNRTTIEPTRRLLEEESRNSKKETDIQLYLVKGALEALLIGDGHKHDNIVKSKVLEIIGNVDVVVLAQASMARVLRCLSDTERTKPILSSPHSALNQLSEILGLSR
jgi:Asp/Glu/hydantoin racemase